ncbi:hypothetical protein [Streptomyces sp. NPDC002952]|uniref:hypothetical protein n=1 Tax=Streptomyces sp. NPDC002952 TaxID=3364673 RepID=UPI0036B8DCF4
MKALSTVQWLRTAVNRVAVGSERRATYIATWTVHRARYGWKSAGRWLNEASGLAWIVRAALLLAGAAIARKILTAVGASVYERMADGGAPILCWGAAAWWVVSAYRAGAEDWEPKRPAVPQRVSQDAADGQEQAPPAPEQPPAGPPPVSPVQLVATVRDIGTPHAQLKPLAEHLGTTTDAVRAAAAGIGWPVKDVRMEGRSSSAGLRWDDCPSPTILAPSPGVVGAGQGADDNDDDSGERRGREGFRVEDIGLPGRIVYDPAETVRHHPVRGN